MGIPIAYRKPQIRYSVLGRIFKKFLFFFTLKKNVSIVFKVASYLRYKFHTCGF